MSGTPRRCSRCSASGSRSGRPYGAVLQPHRLRCVAGGGLRRRNGARGGARRPERGALTRCDAVLSGYMGSAGIGEAILEAVAAVRAENPQALYCCDPVIGDTEEGVYVRPGHHRIHARARRAGGRHPHPNQFELNLLTGLPSGTLGEARTAIAALQAGGRGWCSSPRPPPPRRPPTASISWQERRAPVPGAHAPASTSRSTARAIASRPCSSSTTRPRARRRWPWSGRRPRFTACCGAPPRRGGSGRS